MHIAQRIATILVTVGLTTGLAGCGFHLKGTSPDAAPLTYKKLTLALPKDTDELQKQLSVYLAANGVQLSQASDAYVLRVLDYTPRRQLLRGKLVEVLLRLTVTFQIEDSEGRPVTQPRTLTATRSYQYNLETVNTDNQQESYLNNIVIDDIARQIARQMYANRLPKITTQQ